MTFVEGYFVVSELRHTKIGINASGIEKVGASFNPFAFQTPKGGASRCPDRQAVLMFFNCVWL